MKKILVAGLKDPAGGVESAVMEQVRHLVSDEVRADFVIFGRDFSLEKEINDLGGKVIYLPSRVKKRGAYKAALKEIFKNEDYSAVWCNFSGLTNIDLLRYASAAGVPVRIAHAHTSMFAWGNPLMKYLVPLMHRKNQRVVHKYTTHFFTCAPAASLFMFGEENAKKAILIKNSVDTEKYKRDEAVRAEVREEFSLCDRPVVIHVGRMCTAKNQLFLLDIFSEILKKSPNTRLLFVGDGELWDSVTGYAKEKGFKDEVIFAGNRCDVPRLLQAADAFLLPSVTEGLPVTAVEAQAAGLCCVVSKEAVPVSVDVTGNVKFLSLNESLSTWADAVVDALDNYIPNGHEKVAEGGYDSRVSAKALKEFFLKGE